MCFPSFQKFFGEVLEIGGGGGSDAHSHQVFYNYFLQVCRGCIPFVFSSNKEWQLCCFFLFSTFFTFPGCSDTTLNTHLHSWVSASDVELTDRDLTYSENELAAESEKVNRW